MAQKQYTEKPRKVLGEQFAEGADPDAIGVCRCGLSPIVETGPPHVHALGGMLYVHDTEWIVSSRSTGEPIAVLSDAAFQEAFGSGNPNE